MPDSALKTKPGKVITECPEKAMKIIRHPTEEPTKNLHTGSKDIPDKKETTTGGRNTEKDPEGMMWIGGGRIGVGGMRMIGTWIGIMMVLEGAGEKIVTEGIMVIDMLMNTGRIMVGRESTIVRGGKGLAAILGRDTEDGLHHTQEVMTVTTESHALIIVIVGMTGEEMREEVGTTTGLGEVLNIEVLLQVLTRPRIDVLADILVWGWSELFGLFSWFLLVSESW